MSDLPIRRVDQRLQRHCDECNSRFTAHPRLGKRQKTCGANACKRAHRASYRRHYRRVNSESEQGYIDKIKSNRSKDYWKNYRTQHPVYAARNRANSRLKKALKRAGLQRQLDIVQLVDPIENLDKLVVFATSTRSLLEECVCRAAA